MKTQQSLSPLFDPKYHEAPSVFTAPGLIREARRQKNLKLAPVPSVCVLDPDGDMIRHLQASGRAERDPAWACYHTDMYRVNENGLDIGIVGCAVGAPFAVLVAEQMFACGCDLLISITSAGQLLPLGKPPYFILIERALRDEGTSHHYLPPSRFSHAPPAIIERLSSCLDDFGVRILRGATWTTDAPFRETETAIEARKAEGLMAVEMEAAALYAFAEASGSRVICFAHVTNQMAQIPGDFEKGEADGTVDALILIRAVSESLNARPSP